MSNVIAIGTVMHPRTEVILNKWNKVIAFFPFDMDTHALAAKILLAYPSATVRQLVDTLHSIIAKRKDV